MAINALQSASSGLSALNTALDVTANNLANINTTGFKSSRVNYQDLLYLQKQQPGVENAIGDKTPAGVQVGLGVKVASTQLDFSEGAPLQTGRPLDIQIEGQGFLQVGVEQNIGTTGYTRAGNLALNADRELVLANDQGRRVQPVITIDPSATAVSIDSAGRVYATFPNPGGLLQMGENLYTESAGSGPPTTGEPGTDNRGTIRQGFLENSNVDPTKEMIELIRTQRAFEFNSQSIRAADDSLRSVAQIRR
jgi:flagellar basal-body rod protein FlgG